jgi:hypothetical protein
MFPALEDEETTILRNTGDQRYRGTASRTGRPEFSVQNTFYSKEAKVIPLQAWTVPEGSRRLKLLDFKTIGT